ncbi:hypothetical protein F2Q70_00003219 [Brassica cretica]|uniref:Uncharacterized protein n=1 Tax=Brassica cretica TaxID=69181 RepID=A0A8S9IMY9_BRACR|nr:hypothetical protein F2Q70_00003219 [Brassica cretica]
MRGSKRRLIEVVDDEDDSDIEQSKTVEFDRLQRRVKAKPNLFSLPSVGGRKNSRPTQGNGKKNAVHAESSQPQKKKIQEELLDLEGESEEDKMDNENEGRHWSDVCTHQKLTDIPGEESVDSSPEDWENDYYNPTVAAYTRHNIHTEEYDEDYEEEQAADYRAILDEEDKLLYHSSWKKNAPSIDGTISTSIDTQAHHTNRKRSSTDIAYHPSIDTGVDRVREGDHSIGNWADDYHHASYAVETEIHKPRADELHEGFTYEELLNMQRRDEADQQQASATGEGTRFSHSIDRANHPSIDENLPSSVDIRPKTEPTISENPNLDNQYLTPDEFDILQMANGADNLFMQQRTIPANHQRVTKEFYDTAGGIDNRFTKKYRHPTRPSTDVNIPPSVDRRPKFVRRAFDLFETGKFYWKEKNEYGVYKDDQRCARDVYGHIINVSKEDIRKLMERASKDEHNYICLPEHASSFTQTNLVPEIYTKDEINEIFYGVCGAQEKNEGDFQVKLDGVYYPLNDSISWLTTCMEEMR